MFKRKLWSEWLSKSLQALRGPCGVKQRSVRSQSATLPMVGKDSELAGLNKDLLRAARGDRGHSTGGVNSAVSLLVPRAGDGAEN